MAIKTDEERLTSSQLAQVEAAQKKWQEANEAGDTAGMEAAHKEAEAVRNSAGYTSDGTGNYLGTYSSGGSKGGNSQYTNTNKIYNPNTDYYTLMTEAANNGKYKDAAMYEQLRNQKILGEGMDYETTNLYGNYLDGYSSQKNQQDAMDMFNQYVQEWGEKNARPTEPERDPRIDAMLNRILNRDDFSYDAMNDPLYEQYKQMYQREGDRAMRETLAEAASGAGGMNSYAITAAQQANNYYNSQLNDKIPELYQLAYQMYLQDKESMVQDLGILQDMDDAQYSRYRDTINDYYNDKNFAYGVYQDAVNQGNWQTEFNYNAMVNDREFNYNDLWRNKEWDADQAWNEKEWDYIEAENKYNKDKYDREVARDDVWRLIELGVISPELIAKAEMDEEAARAAVDRVLGPLRFSPVSFR